MNDDYKEIYISVLKEIERLKGEEQKLDVLMMMILKWVQITGK